MLNGFFLALTIVLTCALVALIACFVWAYWRVWRIDRRHAAELERYSRWPCPNCQEPFGSGVEWISFTKETEEGAKARFDIEGKPFVGQVGICCPHCHRLNEFDANGHPAFGKGFLYPDGWDMQGDEEHWERLARELACPRCGVVYEGWSGCVWSSNRDEPIISQCPVMRCPGCGADAWVIEEENGPRIVEVFFQGERWKAS